MAGDIEQSAGQVRVQVSTGGWPLACRLTVQENNSEVHDLRVGTGELHDLRYCIDRVLARLAAEGTP